MKNDDLDIYLLLPFFFFLFRVYSRTIKVTRHNYVYFVVLYMEIKKFPDWFYMIHIIKSRTSL